jgi:hypothetical protein
MDIPERLTYTLRELQRVNQSRDLLYDVVRMLTMNKYDDPLAATKSAWLHRGMTLQMLDKLHAAMADLN